MASIAQFVGFDYMTEGTVAEIQRNVSALIATPEGSCPGDRSYGISTEFIGMPIDVARNLSALSVIEKLEIYEPRVELIDVSTESDPISGSIKNIFTFGPNSEYEDEEDTDEDEDEDEDEEEADEDEEVVTA